MNFIKFYIYESRFAEIGFRITSLFVEIDNFCKYGKKIVINTKTSLFFQVQVSFIIPGVHFFLSV